MKLIVLCGIEIPEEDYAALDSMADFRYFYASGYKSLSIRWVAPQKTVVIGTTFR